MTNLALDLRFALRALRRSPLFSTVAILSVALGIGCNTAIFTLLDQILLRQLPVKEPDKLVMLYQRGAHNGNNMGDRMHSTPSIRISSKRRSRSPRSSAAVWYPPRSPSTTTRSGWTPKWSPGTISRCWA